MADATQPTDSPDRGLVAARRRDRLVGLLIVVVAFLIALGISWWAKLASRPESAPTPGPPTSSGIEGYPSAVDPIQVLGLARELTRRTLLRGIWAEGVRSDGTLDLGEGHGRARYLFQSPPGEGPQPQREPGTLARRHYCGTQTVHLRREGLVADPDVADIHCPLPTTEHLPDPRCTLRDVWQHAIRKGAPRNQLSRVEYYRSRAGPAYKFELPGTQYRFSLYGDCERELTQAEALPTP
jgi:hypothetical protein